MELKILSKKDNKIFDRKDIEFWMLSEGQKKEAVKTELCKMENLHPDATIIVRIDSEFGSRGAKGIAHSYKTKEMLMKHESKFLLKRVGLMAKEEKDAAPKAAKQEKPEGEAKAEAKK